MNRVELKKLMYDFISISNRLMKADCQEYGAVLARFIAHLDGVELIRDYITDCGAPSYDVEAEVQEVIASHGGAYFTLGDTTEKEVTNIYHILRHCWQSGIDIPLALGRSYSHSTKVQDRVKAFNDRVVMVLTRHIEGYLTKIGIDMGMDESIRYSITVNNGQVNLASDNATINANQYNGVDMKVLQRLIEDVQKTVPGSLGEEDAEAVKDTLNVIESELALTTPRRGLLRTASAGLQAIKGTAEFGAAIATLIQFVRAVM